MPWTFASAIQAGAAHPDACQDALWVEADGETLVAAVADGAGSARHSKEGADAACRAFARLAPRLLRIRSRREAADLTLREVRGAICEAAGDRPVGDLACTLVGVVLRRDAGWLLQIGDGAAVVGSGRGYALPHPPEESEFLNSTYFITDRTARSHLFAVALHGVREVALMTDGIQHFVIGPKRHRPHPPFFTRVFGNLRAEAGRDEAASAWLAQMLASPFVAQRTEDDVSLVVARRRP
jgi:hypothetical protein